MAYKPRYGTKHRDYLYSEARTAAYIAGRGEFPICPHCDQPVMIGQAWDEVHVGAPRCFGGKSKAVGHRDCNQLDNNRTVTPAAAKAKRVWRRHVGIAGPGLGRHPMPCGRRSPLKKTMRGDVVARTNLAEQHRALLEQRSLVPLEVQP